MYKRIIIPGEAIIELYTDKKPGVVRIGYPKSKCKHEWIKRESAATITSYTTGHCKRYDYCTKCQGVKNVEDIKFNIQYNDKTNTTTDSRANKKRSSGNKTME